MKKLAGAALLITALTVLSRIAGFGRTVVFLQTVGDGPLGNIYNAANTIPNIVFELVAGGALASLVVPLLAGDVAAGRPERAGRVASALLTWVLVVMVPLAVLVALLAGPISGLLPDVPPEHRAVAASMLRVFAPQLPLYGAGIVLTGVLQAHHRFAWPVIAPLLSSVTVMAAYLTYASVDGPRTGFGGLTRTGELILSIGTTLGVVMLALCLLIPLRRLRLRWRPTFRFPGDEGRRAIGLGWAGAVTVGSQQVMVGVVIVLAVSDGLTAYNAAQTVFLLPWAVLAVPLATAVYPTLAAADQDGFQAALAPVARSVMLLAGWGAAALFALGDPIAYLVGTTSAAPGIRGFAAGLFGYALFALLSRALYARGATRAAAASTAAGWGIAAIAAVALTAGLRDQVFALGLANAIGMSAIGVLLVVAVRRHTGAASLSGLGRAAVAGIVAAVVAASAGWFSVRAVAGGTGSGFGGSVVQGLAGGLAVFVAYLAAVLVLDRRDLAGLPGLRGRRSRPGAAGATAAETVETAGKGET